MTEENYIKVVLNEHVRKSEYIEFKNFTREQWIQNIFRENRSVKVKLFLYQIGNINKGKNKSKHRIMEN